MPKRTSRFLDPADAPRVLRAHCALCVHVVRIVLALFVFSKLRIAGRLARCLCLCIAHFNFFKSIMLLHVEVACLLSLRGINWAIEPACLHLHHSRLSITVRFRWPYCAALRGLALALATCNHLRMGPPFYFPLLETCVCDLHLHCKFYLATTTGKFRGPWPSAFVSKGIMHADKVA